MSSHAGRRAPRLSGLWGVAGLGFALAASGCSPDPAYTTPGFGFAASYRAARAGVPVLLSNDAWWQRFRDRTLDALVAEALAGNLSLASARDRVAEAAANLRAVPGGVGLSSQITAQTQGNGAGLVANVGSVTLSPSWLLDPYGGRRDQLRAADARLSVADAEVNAARLLVLSNLGNAYVDLRYQQRLLALRVQELAARRKTLALTQTFFDANSATRLDVVRAEARIAEVEAMLPALKAAIQAGQNQIAVLTGVAPGQLAIDLDGGAGQPWPHLSPDVGIPADLLRNRPDIRIAERLYYAAVADTGVARAGLYPRLSLGGSISLTTSGGATATAYDFGPTLSFPAILSKAPRAAVDASAARARQAQDAWKSTVLTALQEVEDALASYSAASRSVAGAEKTVRLYGQVVSLTDALIAKDGATLRDRMDAEGSIADANVTLADNLHQLDRSFVALNVALGSGNAGPVAPP